MRAPIAALALLAFASAVAACGGSDSGSSTAPTAGTTAAATTAAPATTAPALPPPPAATDIEAAGAARIERLGEPDWLALAGGSVWAAGVGDGIGWLDPKTGALVDSLPVAGAVCLAMDVGFGSLWAGSCGADPAILRIDPVRRKIVATIPIGASDLSPESSIAAGEGAVWVQTADADLVKIDPQTSKVLTKVKAPAGVVALRAGLGALWATNVTDGTLLRMNPADATVQATIPVGDQPRFLAVGENAVWVLNQGDGTVTRVDPATNAVAATVDVDTGSVDGGDIAVGGGAVWARVSDSLVVEIDPATNTAQTAYGPPHGSGSVAADDDAMWVSAHDVSSVWRLPLQ
jgi:YVTN family beta-propeller protein